MTIKLILEFAVLIGALLMEPSPQKARILLMLGLMKTSEPKKLQPQPMPL